MMVRLEVENGNGTEAASEIFQFHDGAIGRMLTKNDRVFLSRFQFHDGAIGRS